MRGVVRFFVLSNTFPTSYSRLSGSVEIVFWSLFGQVELKEFETEDNYNVIKTTALVVFGIFNVLAVLVALNMLIAMLNESYVLYAVRTGYTW